MPHPSILSFAAAGFFCYSSGMDEEILLLRQNALRLGIALDDAQLAQFDVYKNELLLWNAKTNLVSEKSSHEIVERHFLDSLTARPFIQKTDARMMDIGCGAGFPGIPLKIALQAMELYLLESNRKKVSFLKHILRLLNLSSVYVLHDRVENIINKDLWKEKFDIVISRAAFKLDELFTFGEFFLAPEGQLIALKGPGAEQEIRHYLHSKNQSKISQLIQHDIEAFSGETTRKIIIGKK